MDIDRYIAKNANSWRRLQELTEKAGGNARKLDSAELEELVQLYQRVSAHLSHVRAEHQDRGVINHLSGVLASARQVIYSRRSPVVNALRTFFVLQLPGAMWTVRKATAICAALFVVTALASGLFLSQSRQARNVEVSPTEQKLIVESEFEDYYKSEAASDFAAKIQLNNILVGFLALGGGLLFGAVPLLMVFNEGLRFGTLAAVMHAGGAGAKFWGLVLPHGLAELTAVFIAAGAGLHMGWSLISPGRRTRAQALADAGATAVATGVGCAIIFIVAGFVEAFVTPSGLPTSARIVIGVLVWSLVIAYVFAFGPRAADAGYTGRSRANYTTWQHEGDTLDAWLAPARPTARPEPSTAGTP